MVSSGIAGHPDVNQYRNVSRCLTVIALFRTMELSCVICEHLIILKVLLQDTEATKNKQACSDINRCRSSLWQPTASLETFFFSKQGINQKSKGWIEGGSYQCL